MRTLWQDIRYGFRVLGRRPGLTVAAVLCLGLGIAAATTIFSVVNGALLRPFPYRNPCELALVWQESSKEPVFAEARSISALNFADCRQMARAFADMALVGGDTRSLRHGDRLELVCTLKTGSNLLGLLGISPILGRGFLPEEDQGGHPQVAILTHDCWRKRFQCDPNVLGMAVMLRSDGDAERSYAIVGVLPSEFVQPVLPWFKADILVPLELPQAEEQPMFRAWPRYEAVGRLREGATLQQAQVNLDLVTRRLTEQWPKENEGLRLMTASLRSNYSRGVHHVLGLLLGASGLLLFVACANVAGLLLIRGLERGKEITIRATLGAGRLRVLRQLVLEGLAVAVLGLIAGLLISVWALEALRPLILTYVHTVGEISLDVRVLVFAAVIALVTGVGFGLIPAFQAWKTDLAATLKGDSTQATMTVHARSFHGLLVAGQIALALILIVGAGLAVRTFVNLLRIDPGFNPRHVLAMWVRFPGDDRKRDGAFQDELIARTRALPGVVSAAMSDSLPLCSQGNSFLFDIEGYPTSTPDGYDSSLSSVSEDYFRTLGVPVIQGRDFQEADRLEKRPVVIINRILADRFWPGGNPVGARLKERRSGMSFEVIGVVENECYRDSQITGELEVSPRVFLNRYTWTSAHLTIRTEGDPLALVSGVKTILRTLDDQALAGYVQTMESRVREAFQPQQLAMWLVGVFALFAFTLTVVGLYGVMTHSSRSRSREIAIRLATGARPADIVRMVLRQGARIVMIGMAIGLAGILALARVAVSYVYGVAPLDVLTLAAAVLLLGIASLSACSLPARRAAKVDPMAALRHE